MKILNLTRRLMPKSILGQSQSEQNLDRIKEVLHVEPFCGNEYPEVITLQQRSLWSENQRKMYLFFNKQLRDFYESQNPAVKEAKNGH